MDDAPLDALKQAEALADKILEVCTEEGRQNTLLIATACQLVLAAVMRTAQQSGRLVELRRDMLCMYDGIADTTDATLHALEDALRWLPCNAGAGIVAETLMMQAVHRTNDLVEAAAALSAAHQKMAELLAPAGLNTADVQTRIQAIAEEIRSKLKFLVSTSYPEQAN